MHRSLKTFLFWALLFILATRCFGQSLDGKHIYNSSTDLLFNVTVFYLLLFGICLDSACLAKISMFLFSSSGLIVARIKHAFYLTI